MIDSIPLSFLTVSLPILGAVLVRRMRRPADPRVLGGVVAGLVIVAVGWLLAQVVASGGRVEDPSIDLGPLGFRPLFGMDALSGLLALTNAVTAAAVIIGAPRARDERPRIAALLLTEALILIMLTSQDLLLLAIAFCALALPADARRRARADAPDCTRLYRLLFVAGAVPLAGVVAYGLLVGSQPLAQGLDLRIISTTPHEGATVVLGLLLVTVLFRMALLPLHSWLPALTQHGPLGSTVLLIASQSGAYLFVRVAFVFFGSDAGGLTAWLTWGGAISAVYAGVLAMVSNDLRRLIGWLSISQAGLMIVGLCSLQEDGVTGAVAYWVSYGTAVTGLALTIWAVQARMGTTRISELGGLVRSAPRLTVAFAAFAVASVGFPGSLGFVAEDLLVHGVLEVNPILGVTMIVATAFNGIALVRALFRTFLGPSRTDAPADLRPRELWVVGGLAAVAFGLGMWPAGLIDILGLARLCIHT
jgi:NADH-quinone oxidoreductase subunit M